MDNIHGYVHVTGYSGSQVQVSMEKHIYADSCGGHGGGQARRQAGHVAAGQLRAAVRRRSVPQRATARTIAATATTAIAWCSISTCRFRIDTELVLKTINHGDIQVKKTTGDYEIHGLNGGIEMEDVAGSGLVSTLNGKVKVTFSKNPTKATQFKTLNGSVDVYFQNGLNADLKFKKLNGGIYTDFEVTALPQTAAGDSSNGKFVYRLGPQDVRARGKGRAGAVLRHAERQHPASLQGRFEKGKDDETKQRPFGHYSDALFARPGAGHEGERVVVPARNTTHARKVDVNLMGGSITVKGYAGKEVIVEARDGRRSERERERDTDKAAAGMHRLDLPARGLIGGRREQRGDGAHAARATRGTGDLGAAGHVVDAAYDAAAKSRWKA